MLLEPVHDLAVVALGAPKGAAVNMDHASQALADVLSAGDWEVVNKLYIVACDFDRSVRRCDRTGPHPSSGA
jgi:hypothetical protein